MKNLKNILVTLLFLSLFLVELLSAGCGKKKSPPSRPRGSLGSEETGTVQIMAQVGDEKITREQLARSVHAYSQQLIRQGQRPPPNFEDTILDILIESEIIYQAGLKMEIPDLERKVDEQYARILNQYPSEEAMAENLSRGNLTLKELRHSLKKEFIINYILEKRIYDQIDITDKAVENYYNEHQKELHEPEKIRLSQILISVSPGASNEQKETAGKEILALQKRIESGEDFQTLARENSDETVSARLGGNLGFFTRGQMMPAFKKKAWEMEVGEVSDPIEDSHGFHLIRLDEKKPGGIPPLDEIRDRIAERLKKLRTPEKLKQLIGELKKEIKVQKFKELKKS